MEEDDAFKDYDPDLKIKTDSEESSNMKWIIYLCL